MTSLRRSLALSLAMTGAACKSPSEGACLDANPCADAGDASAACGESTTDPTVYTCDCSDGFVFDGATCADEDGCFDDACGTADPDAACADVAAPGTGHTCTCSDGFIEDGEACVEEDGCTASGDPLCDAEGDEAATCVDVPAPGTGYTCACSDGFADEGGACVVVPPSCDAPDLNGDTNPRFPYGSDGDDDGDGLVSYLLGGADFDDSDAGVGLASGDGTFTFHATYVGVSGRHAAGSALADLDEDGDLDVAISLQDPLASNPGGRGAVEWWRNVRGTLTFVGAIADEGGGALLSGDFNGDGLLDVVVQYKIALGACGPTFGAATELAVDAIADAFGDLDHDGDLDLLGQFEGSEIIAMLNDGTGGLTGVSTATPSLSDMTLGRVDSDDYIDVLTTKYGYLEDKPAVVAWKGSSTGALTETDREDTRTSYSDPVLGDIDGDGHADAIVVDWLAEEIVALLGAGDGTFAASVTVLGGLASPEQVALPDLDGDGDLDLVFVDQVDGLGVALGDGDGTFGEATYLAAPGAMYLSLGDLNGDTKFDVVVSNGGEDSFSVFFGE